MRIDLLKNIRYSNRVILIDIYIYIYIYIYAEIHEDGNKAGATPLILFHFISAY